MENLREKRIRIEYLVVGSGLVLTSIRCYINWKYKVLVTNEIIGNISLLLLFIASIIVTLMSQIHKIEKRLKDSMMSAKKTIVKTRENADLGLTNITLLPCSLLFGLLCYNQETSYIYTVTTIISQGYLILSVILLWRMSSRKFEQPSLAFLLLSIMGTSVSAIFVLGKITSISYTVSGPICLLSQFIFLTIWRALLSKSSKSFTIGESIVVSQSGAALFTTCLLWFLNKFFDIYAENYPYSLGEEITQFAVILAIGFGSLVIITFTSPFARSTYGFYIVGGSIVFLLMYPSLFTVFKKEPILWLLSYALQTPPKIFMIFHWATCSVLALAIVAWCNFKEMTVTTIVRKYFHIIVIMVYLPALVWEANLLFLASSVVFAIFVILELIRVLDIPPLGAVLDSSLKIFLDEKDTGPLILTHVYLLFGSSVSLWLLPLNYKNSGFRIATLSGILSLGFGDTAASVGGTWWGKHKWPDSKKSLEGTYTAIAVQSFVTVLLLWISEPSWSWFLVNGAHSVIATSLCCILEGVTTQVDNLVLPLFLYAMLVPL